MRATGQPQSRDRPGQAQVIHVTEPFQPGAGETAAGNLQQLGDERARITASSEMQAQHILIGRYDTSCDVEVRGDGHGSAARPLLVSLSEERPRPGRRTGQCTGMLRQRFQALTFPLLRCPAR